MTYTTHGHYIPGTPTALVESPIPMSNCGRFRECLQCASEAAEAMTKHVEALRQEGLHKMGTPDISVEGGNRKNEWPEDHSVMKATAICTCGRPHEVSTLIKNEGVSMDAARKLTSILIAGLERIHDVHVEIVSGVL